MASILNADNGVVSGSAGLKSSADSSGVLALQTNGTTAVTVDNSQNVGVGVTPSAWSVKALQVGGASLFGYTSLNSNIGANFYYDGSSNKYIANGAASLFQLDAGAFKFFSAASGTAGNTISFNQAMTLDASGNWILGATATSPSNNNAIWLSPSSSTARFTNTGAAGKEWSIGTSSPGVAGVGDYFSFARYSGSAWAEFGRFDSSGNLLVGKTVSSLGTKGIALIGSQGVVCETYSGGDYGVLNCLATSGTNYAKAFWQNGNTEVGSIRTTNSATSYVTSSDYRLKENVQPMTGALGVVAQLKPCTYTWKTDGTEGQGFIAHELQAVVPDAVVGEKDAINEDGSIKPQGIDTSFLVATLTAAIQEQQALIDQLKARLDAANL